jgi:hypothetical protein
MARLSGVFVAVLTVVVAVGATACGGDPKADARAADQAAAQAASQTFHCGPPDYTFENGTCSQAAPRARGSALGSEVVSNYQCPWFWPVLHCTWFGDCYCAAY